MKPFFWTQPETIEDLCIDFDDTICHTGGHPTYIPNKPIKGSVEAINELAKKYSICIFTSRHWIDAQNIANYCKYYGIHFDSIVCGKKLGVKYIDDRNIEFDGSWQKVLDKMKNVK